MSQLVNMQENKYPDSQKGEIRPIDERTCVTVAILQEQYTRVKMTLLQPDTDQNRALQTGMCESPEESC